MNNEIDMQKVLGSLGNGQDNSKLKEAVKNRNMSGIMSSLNEKDRRMFQSLLNDKQARDELMSSPQVQELLKSLMKGSGK